MKKIFVIIALMACISQSFAQAKNEDQTNEKVNGRVVKPIIIQSKPRWGRHGGEINCPPRGVYCFGNPLEKIKTLEPDMIESETSIMLTEKNNIVITTIGVKGEITNETFELFKNKKIEISENRLPDKTIAELFKSIGFSAPKEPIIFSPENRKYNIYKTTNDGTTVQIIEVVEKSKVIIKDKPYNVIIITTSGKGAGSPKQAGF